MTVAHLPTPAPVVPAPLQLLNKQQLAKRMGVSVRTIENLVHSGEFPGGVRIGRCVYWTERVVVAWQRQLFAAQDNWQP